MMFFLIVHEDKMKLGSDLRTEPNYAVRITSNSIVEPKNQ